jgi:peptide methionine sulfoxide reductase msrA/msrB
MGKYLDHDKDSAMDKSASLTEIVLRVVKDKGTEKPFTGEYDQFDDDGTYLCRQCGLALFRSSTKFHSGCGWPSFDEEIQHAVKRVPDEDGMRTEICCARCGAHLGHVFNGEKFTQANVRHCVNSLSLDFVSDKQVNDTEEAIFAAGCFWGVEYYFAQLKGVLRTEVGYSGGHTYHPTYHDVCSGTTGHYEVIRVIYDPAQITYEDLTKFFFEIHHFAQDDGQGPDIGEQYLSVVFYYDDIQKKTAEKIISLLKKKHYQVSTKVLPVKTFFRAEEYHQRYYAKNGKSPYCHRHEKIF